MIVKQLIIDVTGRVAVDGPLHTSATFYLTERQSLTTPSRAIVALPGGSYSKGYIDISITGLPGYSQARDHVHGGTIVSVWTPRDAGESSTTQLDQLSVESIAASNDYPMRQIIDMLKKGSLDSIYPKLLPLFTVGIGQSMGEDCRSRRKPPSTRTERLRCWDLALYR